MVMGTAFDRLKNDYDSQGQPYQIGAHYYFSTGAFPFEIPVIKTDANGFNRMTLRCPGGTKIQFFSYGINDDVNGVGLSPNIKATDSETNLAERQQTNNEDFAIEGLAAGSRGCRISYPNVNAGFTSDARLFQQLRDGDLPWSDLGSTILPPELSSPLALHDALFEAIKPFCSLHIFFDRKGGDHVCRLDKVPQGGARSYLYANGEPSAHNFFRIPEGYVWRSANSKTDRLLMIEATIQQDVYSEVTLPSLWQPVSPVTDQLGAPAKIWCEFSLWLHGRAFYMPGKNI